MHAIEKEFIYLVMGFSGEEKDREVAVKIESGRGRVAPEAFAWTMHRFGFWHASNFARQAPRESMVQNTAMRRRGSSSRVVLHKAIGEGDTEYHGGDDELIVGEAKHLGGGSTHSAF